MKVVQWEHGCVVMMSTKMKASTFALAVLSGIIIMSWIISIRLVNGMDMGPATRLGTFFPFIIMWVIMMAAMMLPGTTQTVSKIARAKESFRDAFLFIASYLFVWSLFGIIVYLLYRPHGFAIAGAFVIAAGIYELLPLKKYFRHYCCMKINSGFIFGLYCVGSSIGLMLIQVELGVMSLLWMLLISVIITAQKFLPAKIAFDIPLALFIIGFGIWIIIAPSSVPAFTQTM
jgi:predicted metal-binding membrane protein